MRQRLAYLLNVLAAMRVFLRAKADAFSALASSANFWYVVLTLCGIGAASRGVAIEFGQGYGYIVFGALCLLGSEILRGGMRRG